MSLQSEIQALRGELAAAAQSELDTWVINEAGYDEEFGYGGACDAISRKMGDVLAGQLENTEVTDGGQDGDDHAYLLCLRANESVVVDIPPSLYEVGGGYSWRKRVGVRLEAQDVLVEEIDLGVTAGGVR